MCFQTINTNPCYYFISKGKVDYRLLFYHTKSMWIRLCYATINLVLLLDKLDPQRGHQQVLGIVVIDLR